MVSFPAEASRIVPQAPRGAALEGARVWKGAQPDEFYTDDWHDPRKMYEEGERQVSDDDLMEALIISADPGMHVERIREIEQSLSLIAQLLDSMPQGALRIDLPAARGACEGTALVEGFRGDILVWLRLDAASRIARCHLRDPSWFQWPLLEAAIEDNIVADFPLCNKSFNCSYSGHDL